MQNEVHWQARLECDCMPILLLFAFFLAALPLHALQLTVGAQPLQHALARQLFAAPDGRYYLRGKRDAAGCYLYAEDPQLQFRGDRILLTLHLSGKVGSNAGGVCLGVNWAGNAEISMLPEAQGSVIGFGDVRVERLTGDHTLDRLLQPLLASLVPKSFRVDAGPLVDKLLHTASDRSAATITMRQLAIDLIAVQQNTLHLSLEGEVSIE